MLAFLVCFSQMTWIKLLCKTGYVSVMATEFVLGFSSFSRLPRLISFSPVVCLLPLFSEPSVSLRSLPVLFWRAYFLVHLVLFYFLPLWLLDSLFLCNKPCQLLPVYLESSPSESVCDINPFPSLCSFSFPLSFEFSSFIWPHFTFFLNPPVARSYCFHHKKV